MAKKSNKTEHVLKLITKNDEAAQDDFFVINQEISENGTSAVRTVVKAEPEEEPEEIELALKPSVERELRYETKLKIEIEPEIEFKVKEPVKQAVPAEVETPAAPSAKEPPMLRAFREQESAGSAILEHNDSLVNVAEILAREKLALVMERMKVCSCKTCVNDVLALALNSLPTKYVTTDAGRQYFQLETYKKQYETDILAALTKACVRVKAAPRHEK